MRVYIYIPQPRYSLSNHRPVYPTVYIYLHLNIDPAMPVYIYCRPINDGDSWLDFISFPVGHTHDICYIIFRQIKFSYQHNCCVSGWQVSHQWMNYDSSRSKRSPIDLRTRTGMYLLRCCLPAVNCDSVRMESMVKSKIKSF